MMSRATPMLGLTLIASLAVAAAPAQAAVVTISLDGVTFSDGATASGSFSFDTVAGTSSNFSVATTAGSLPGASFGASATSFWNSENVGQYNGTYETLIDILNNTAPLDYMVLMYVAPTTDYSDYIAANPDSYLTTSSNVYSVYGPSYEFNDGNTRAFASVSASNSVSTPVPEPASLALIGAGLLGLGGARRRRRGQAAD